MSGDQELPYAQLVRDWAEGKPLPHEVQAIKDGSVAAIVIRV